MANLSDIFPDGFLTDDDSIIDTESEDNGPEQSNEKPTINESLDGSDIPEPEIKSPPPRAFALRSVKDLLTNPPLVRWLVHGVIEAETLTLLFGPSGAGKSFVALDLAASISCGFAWHGHHVSQGPAVYILGEGSAGVSRRMKAWHLTHPEANLPEAPLYISNRIVPLGESEAIAEIDSAIQEAGVGTPSVIFIDTLARAAVGMDENSSRDMGEFLYVCDQIRYKYKCVVIIVHHTGHIQGRARGSTTIKGSLDVELSLTTSDGIISLETPKVKEEQELKPFTFQLQRVDTGWLDEDGEPVYSAAIVPAEPVEVQKKDSKLSSYRKMFENAWRDCGQEEKEGMPYLTKSALLNYFIINMGMSEATAKQYVKPSATGKIIADLLTSNVIRWVENGWVVCETAQADAMMMLRNQ